MPVSMMQVSEEMLLQYGKTLAVNVYEALVAADASAEAMTESALIEAVFVELIRRRSR
jgi:hypothetical protein